MNRLNKVFSSSLNIDGASAHFKNNFSIYNLVHHRQGFDIEACWIFTRTGHGKGLCDGVDASVKPTAIRAIMKSGISLSSAEVFYRFTVQYNRQTAKSTTSKEPPISAFYADSSTIEDPYDNLLKCRSDNMNGVIRTNTVILKKILGMPKSNSYILEYVEVIFRLL